MKAKVTKYRVVIYDGDERIYPMAVSVPMDISTALIKTEALQKRVAPPWFIRCEWDRWSK